jgi:hypothetical protein
MLLFLIKKLEGEDAESVQKFMKQIELRQKAAENVPMKPYACSFKLFNFWQNHQE